MLPGGHLAVVRWGPGIGAGVPGQMNDEDSAIGLGTFKLLFRRFVIVGGPEDFCVPHTRRQLIALPQIRMVALGPAEEASGCKV